MHKNEKRASDQKKFDEEKNTGFKCLNCGQWVDFSPLIGTAHRNHCPFCFASRHVDLKKSGDRRSECGAKMLAIGLTFKNEGIDKYGKKRQGELMFIHECTGCDKISINRIAGDDDDKKILELFDASLKLNSQKISELKNEGIEILGEDDRSTVAKQLPSIK